MYYSILYQSIFGLAFLNFLIFWTDLFFSSSDKVSSYSSKPTLYFNFLEAESISFLTPLFFLIKKKKGINLLTKPQKKVYGGVLAPCILFILAFAQFNLSSEWTPLVPALKSNWLLMHVSIMIVSYTIFIVAGLISLILIVKTVLPHLSKILNITTSSASIPFFDQFKNEKGTFSFIEKTNYISLEKHSINQMPLDQIVNMNLSSNNFYPNLFDANLKIANNSRSVTESLNNQKLSAKNISTFYLPTKIENFEQRQMNQNAFSITLDQISYRLFGIGFPLFTLGILSGAVWANSAWGSYWSWDIKEVCSMVNWLIIALYLHCRYKNLTNVSHFVGFFALIFLFFNFFGVSLGIFGSSLHAYGASS
uniref:Heme attachment to plastid cytochrome c n=1 Tax=Cephaleuros lagerheimii TaxID=2738443 RepID=UPI0030031A5D